MVGPTKGSEWARKISESLKKRGRAKSVGIAALTGGIGSGIHAGLRAANNKEVSTKSHMLGGTLSAGAAMALAHGVNAKLSRRSVKGALKASIRPTSKAALAGAIAIGANSLIGEAIGASLYKKKSLVSKAKIAVRNKLKG